MTLVLSLPSLRAACRGGVSWSCMRSVAVAVLMVGFPAAAKAQDTPPPAHQSTSPSTSQTTPAPEEKEKIIKGFVTHQSIELGGHIVDESGSGAMYNTLVNIKSGPRILNQSLTMRATDPSHAKFMDNLSR